MMKHMKKSTFVIMGVSVLCTLTIGALFIKQLSNKRKEQKNIEMMDETKVYYISSNQKLRMEQEASNPSDTIILKEAWYQRDKMDGQSDISFTKDEEMNLEFPVYEKDGAVLFFGRQKYQCLYDDLTIGEGSLYTWITCGSAFDSSGNKRDTKTIALVKLENQYLMNSVELLIHGEEEERIMKNSVLHLYEDSIVVYEPIGNSLVRSVIPINEVTLVEMGELKYSYDYLVECVNPQETRKEEIKKEKIVLDEPWYHFYLGNKYEFNEKSILYWCKSGYIVESGDRTYLLDSDPIYVTNQDNIILPKDYVLVQPNQYCVNRLPQYTKMTVDESIVFFERDNQKKVYGDVFLFDGKQKYILCSPSTLTIGKEEYELSALSYVNMENELQVEFYDYRTKEYRKVFRNGRSVQLHIFDSILVNVDKATMTRKNKAEELLMSDPSILPDIP